jgi:beta-phosphoglucomutase
MTALILDMDGVIIESNQMHAEIWKEYLEEHGLYRDGIMQWMHGKRNDQIVAEIFGKEIGAEAIFRHGADKEARYRDRMRPVLEQHLVPGLRAFLERYSSLPLAVASNAEPKNVHFVLEEAGLANYFRVVVDGHQVQNPKPAPDLYLLAAQRLGVNPQDCIVFEDSPGGITAARAAGARVVGVTTVPGAVLPPTDHSIPDFTDPSLPTWLSPYTGI